MAAGPVLAAATTDAEAPAVPGVLVLVHAPTARRMIAAAAIQMAMRVAWRGGGPGPCVVP